MFEFDERIKKYETTCKMVDGKGHVVSIDEGTRIYRELGSGGSFTSWLVEVQEAFDGELIPFEWVADYVGVTSAALHKRVKKGNLTVLVYEVDVPVKGVLGGLRKGMRREYKYVPMVECDGWHSDLCKEEYESFYDK